MSVCLFVCLSVCLSIYHVYLLSLVHLLQRLETVREFSAV